MDFIMEEFIRLGFGQIGVYLVLKQCSLRSSFTVLEEQYPH